MFTGIVETTGRIVASDSRPFGRRLVVEPGNWQGRSGHLGLGDSVAVNGVCLTLAELDGTQLHFDVVTETLTRSTLGALQPGDTVNLESSLIASTPLGGHFVQGHVDGVGEVREIRGGENEPQWVIAIVPPDELLDCLPPKGSVAVEGVSLTVAHVGEDAFEVALVPTTLERTTLAHRQAGDHVNIETDMVTRSVVHWLRQQHGSQGANRHADVTWHTLREAGFLS